MATRRIRSGKVTTFDDSAGLGELTESNGSIHSFHCTAIADGSRSIPVDTEVRFELLAGRVGRFEAYSIVPA